MVSSLLPFISKKDVSYYSGLKIEKLTLLVSLAPFVNNPDTMMKLSKLDIVILKELIGKLPHLDDNELEKYLNHIL